MRRTALRLKAAGAADARAWPKAIAWLSAIGLGFIATACQTPPRPDAMAAFESLRQASDGDTLRERAAALTTEADVHLVRAHRAYEDDRDVELATHEALLAAVAWRTALARSQHMDHEASARAARARLSSAEDKLASATRRRESAQDALARTRRLVATQHRLVEAEQRARTARKAGRAKSALDQVALVLVQAEAAGAGKYASDPLHQAEKALADALNAYEAQDYKAAEEHGKVASLAAVQALEMARPLSQAAGVSQAQATQLLALVAESARLAGGTAVLDVRGVVLRLHDLFEPRGLVLKASAQEAVRQIVVFAGAQPDLRLLIEGHADGTGKAEAKTARAHDQAHALGRALLSAGLAADRVRVVGMGAAMPIADSGTLAGRRSNRRFEVVFLQPETVWPAAAAGVAPEAPASRSPKSARSAMRSTTPGLEGASPEPAAADRMGAVAKAIPPEPPLNADGEAPVTGPQGANIAEAPATTAIATGSDPLSLPIPAPLPASAQEDRPETGRADPEEGLPSPEAADRPVKSSLPAQPASAPASPASPTSVAASAASPASVPASAASPASVPASAASPASVPASAAKPASAPVQPIVPAP